MKIKFIVKRGDGCSWHRLYNPLDNMFDADVSMGIYGEDEDPGECDIYMFNRDVSMSPEALIELKRERGFKIVVDIDDYWILYPSHHLYNIWNQSRYGERMLSFINIADVVTTTTPILGQSIPHNNVFIYPNTLPLNLSPSPSHDNIKFIYSGGASHRHDVEILRSTFKRISQDNYIKNNSEFILTGVSQGDDWEVMRKIFMSTTSYSIYGSAPLTEYMDMYDKGDVSLIPLLDNEFNNHKSELKIIEAAAKSIPCIVSNVWPYKALYHTKAPGLLWVNSHSDWLKHIRFCIKNPSWVKEEGQKLHEFISKHYDPIFWAGELRKQLEML